MAQRSRLVCVGLDGATWRVLRPAIDAGELPFFKMLCERGSWGVLLSTIPSITSPALPSLYTGKNPGKTGVFDFLGPHGNLLSALDIKDETFWEVLDREGRRSCIVNLAMTYPAQSINGIMVAGERTAGTRGDLTFPKELEERLGDFQCEAEQKEVHRLLRQPGCDREKIYELCLAQHKRRYRIFKGLAAEDGFDIALYWEGTTDGIQHYCWHRTDLLVRYYQQIEGMLEDVIESFPGANVLIVSDHGGGPAHTRCFHVNAWLRETGFLFERSNRLLVGAASRAARWAKKCVPRNLRLRLAGVVPGAPTPSPRRALSDQNRRLPWVDWSRTAACLDQRWGIGIVAAGSRQERERVRSQIMNELQELKDGDGQRVVRDVWRREELYSGPYLHEVPHIVFRPNEQYRPDWEPSREVFSPRREEPLWQGEHDHAREGIFIAHGPDIRRGGTVEDASIVDVAPTILHLLDCPIPEDMDGRALTEALREDAEPARRAPRSCPPRAPVERHGASYSKDDEAAVRERLKQLGYL